MLIHTAQGYERELRNCQRCATLLASNPVDPTDPLRPTETVVPRPIVRPIRKCPVMLIGQAPGLTEYRTGEPFCGQAGKDIRRLFAECGCDAERFARLVFTSAVAKCFPGSKLVTRKGSSEVRRADLKPSHEMLKNCHPFLLAQIELVNPRLIVLLGKMALEGYVELRTGKRGAVRLEDYVGQLQDWKGRGVIPLAHTSGASTWLIEPQRRALQDQAKRHLAEQLALL